MHCTNYEKKSRTQIHGTHVPLEELFTASQADIRGQFPHVHCSGAGLLLAHFTFEIPPSDCAGMLVSSRGLNICCFDHGAPSIDFVLHVF
jgi:hypothetical protein